jgi:peptidoglycan glycosyltransferase
MKDNPFVKKLIAYLKAPHFWAGLILTAMFVALIVNIINFVSNNSYDVISDEHNPRQALLARQNIRGNILSNDGQILAATNVSGNEEERIYPYGELFAHVVGFSTMGKTGIENMMNMNLVTSNASLSSKVDNDINGSKDRGDTVVTTLDIGLQKVAFDSIGYYKGAIVVSEVKTGKILAMVSRPCFDPNEIQVEWEDIVEDEKSTVLLNRATQGLYPPGSTFKILDLLEYVKENPNNYEAYGYQCSGVFNYDGRKINCYHGTVHGYQSLRSSFANSCNCSFANIAMNVDRGEFANTLKSMMFDSPLPIDLEYSKSHTPITADAEDGEVVQGSIGQGKTTITPIHMNLITQSIANKGVLMNPMLVDHIENSEGNVLKTYDAVAYRRLMEERQAEILSDYMHSVVTSGTGSFLKSAKYTSAGKTGSADTDSNRDSSHAWFTGFAPYEDPEIAVTIIIEGAGTGGTYAVPIAKRLFDCYFEEKSQE